jgi:hypothetical protein
MAKRSTRVIGSGGSADLSEPVEPACHRGQQAADCGDLNGDQPEEILAMVDVQRNPALIHGLELTVHGLEFAIDGLELTFHRVEAAIYTVE